MAQDVGRAQQRLRQAESLVKFVENGLASGSTNQNELRVAQAKYEAARLDLFDAEKAAAGTPPANAAPASNPTPEPAVQNNRVEQVTPTPQISSGPIESDFGQVVQSTSQADIDRQRRINESLERSAYLDAQEDGRTYVPGAATGDPSAGFTPPAPPPSAVEPREVDFTKFDGTSGTFARRPVEKDTVSPDVSPAAEQAEAPTRTSRRQRAQAQRSAQEDPPVVQQAEESVGEFSDIQRDIAVEPDLPTQDEVVERETTGRRARAQAARVREREPEDPTEDAEVNEQKSNREKAQDQRIKNADAEDLDPLTSPAAARVDSTVSKRAQAQIIRQDSIVRSDPTSYESLTDEQLQQQRASTKAALDRLDALPTQQRLQVQAQIDALEDQLDLLDKESGRRATRDRLEGQVERGKRAPAPVDEPAAGENFNGTGFEPPLDPDEPENFPPEPEAQINSAALERLKAQAAIKQNRDPESTGDWRVKLRLASGSTYLYKLAQQEGTTGGAGQNLGAGILTPLVATDGVVFPYTPRISTLYSAEYNVYHPTHSNYNQYWYKGSKVGEVQLDATFTAQDTQEADYMLAVIHFFKSASKMFYGQDPNRGSPPPLLFLTGLGQYQYNEHPCVISQFNYILPDDVDYIRAGAPQINGQTDTLQYNLRNKNTNGGPVWAGSTTRRLINGLSPGAEPTIPSSIVNLNSSEATYVPTKIQVSLVLLPVNNRLQISQNFNLSEYGNGNLLKGGMW